MGAEIGVVDDLILIVDGKRTIVPETRREALIRGVE
jgi:hypothetical protein